MGAITQAEVVTRPEDPGRGGSPSATPVAHERELNCLTPPPAGARCRRVLSPAARSGAPDHAAAVRNYQGTSRLAATSGPGNFVPAARRSGTATTLAFRQPRRRRQLLPASADPRPRRIAAISGRAPRAHHDPPPPAGGHRDGAVAARVVRTRTRPRPVRPRLPAIWPRPSNCTCDQVTIPP